MNRHVLEGCAPAPFSSYLKAVGIFRVLARQKDARIRAFWKNDRLVLETRLGRDEMLEFILNEYKPSPVTAPWSYRKYKKMRNQLEPLLESERFQAYKETIRKIDAANKEFERVYGVEIGKIDKKTKPLLLRLYRNTLPDEALPWLDAVFVLTGDSIKFAPVLGTGGNDGNFDMPENFAKGLKTLLKKKKPEDSRTLLESALFGGATALENVTTMGHNPDGAGGPNSGMGFGGLSLSNPWEYVMMIEGTILFAGSVARRQSTNTDKAVFPFTTNAANIGYATASDGEEGRGEIWLPIWDNPAGYDEIRHVFSEGRVQLNGRQARTGIEFARAVASYGVERGITEFQQFCILQRIGKMYLTANAGKMKVANKPAVHRISDMDPWYGRIVKQSKSKEAPASLKHLVRSMDSAIMKLCKYQKKHHMLEVLILVGRLSRYASDRNEKPLNGLPPDWLIGCYDETAEFRLAASIASIKPTNGVGGIRENLENMVQDKYGKWSNKRNSPSCVWNETDDLARNMGRVLLRRGVDAQVKSEKALPISANIPARVSDIIAFLEGGLDTKKIGHLIPALSLVDTSKRNYPWQNDTSMNSAPLPEAYSIMKLICPPAKVDNIPLDMSALNLLSAGRIDEAYARASQILYSHGLVPLRYSKRTGASQNVALTTTAKRYLLASLLFPVSDADREGLIRRTILTISEHDMESDGSKEFIDRWGNGLPNKLTVEHREMTLKQSGVPTKPERNIELGRRYHVAPKRDDIKDHEKRFSMPENPSEGQNARKYDRGDLRHLTKLFKEMGDLNKERKRRFRRLKKSSSEKNEQEFQEMEEKLFKLKEKYEEFLGNALEREKR